jgi:hypothetical protein
MFITMTIPPTATPGAHHVELYGPVFGGLGGPTCGDRPERHSRLAVVKIDVDQ